MVDRADCKWQIWNYDPTHSLTGPLTHWPTDSHNYKEMLSHLKKLSASWYPVIYFCDTKESMTIYLWALMTKRSGAITSILIYTLMAPNLSPPPCWPHLVLKESGPSPPQGRLLIRRLIFPMSFPYFWQIHHRAKTGAGDSNISRFLWS